MSEAEIVFSGGALFSAGFETSVLADVAISAGVVTAVGAPADVAGLIGPGTNVIDATGRLLLPGFQDAHVHPVQAGVELLQCDLSAAADAEECLQIIAAYAATHPDEPWIRGGGWSMEFFAGGTPTAEALDAVVSDRPVLLNNRDHHGVWVNSRALELAEITASTPDPADGRIERRVDNTPAGTLHEGAAALVERVAPPTDPELAYRGLLRAQEELHSLGITGWQDAMVGAVFGLQDLLSLYVRAIEEGVLTARVVAALWWEREQGVEQLAGMVEQRALVERLGKPERLRADSVKIMVDGVAENFTAAMSEPYLDHHGHPTANSGHSFIEAGVLAEVVTAIDAEGFQVHFHSLGDRAVRETLDALDAAALVNGRRDSRHHLAHLQVVDRAEIDRFGEHDATANLQALWACHEQQLDELTVPFISPELLARHYPFGDLRRAGVRLAAGSDWPVSSADPLAAAQVAVTRVGELPDAPPLGGAEQMLDLATFLTAYTAGSAFINRREDTTGRIEPGFAADLVLLDRDPFAGPVGEIAEARVIGTWVDGVRVFER